MKDKNWFVNELKGAKKRSRKKSQQAALSHKNAAEEMKQEFFNNNENVINGSALFDQMSFDEWLENTDRNHNPETVRSDWAVAMVSPFKKWRCENIQQKRIKGILL